MEVSYLFDKALT